MSMTQMLFCRIFFLLITNRLSTFLVDSLPTYNPSTRCHDLIVDDENLTFAICLQRAVNKQHPLNLFTSPGFCAKSYPPFGHLIRFDSLSSTSIERLWQNLIELFKSNDTQIDYPIPNFLWIDSNYTQNQSNQSLWCSEECRTKNSSGEFLILKLHCQPDGPCITTRNTHWDRAPFICVSNQTFKQDQSTTPAPVHISPTYTNDTIVFFDSTSCLVVRSSTHQYTFCFRRQSCPHSRTSAFCTAKSDAQVICQDDKDGSNLLSIENDDEYHLINDVIAAYSNQTLLNSAGLVPNRYIQRAQWMWIDGSRGLNDLYRWNISGNQLTAISEKYWCDNISHCLGGKGREHVVLNIVCQKNKTTTQLCLASRRHSEPGPFICKRSLRDQEVPITNYTFLQTSPVPVITAVYEKNLTSIYYDEHHCLTVQTRTHLYTFCLRRQECLARKAFCTKWSQAEKECRSMASQLLTIDNDDERILITDIMDNYSYEARLAFNGSSYRYFQLADFLWIDGVQQADNRTYRWKNGLEIIPNHLWCLKSECTSVDRPRVMLNLQCKKNNSLICLGTRLEWKPAPYACKRLRPIDACPILFEKIRLIQWSEMLVVTVNRTMALIKCKHPEYSEEIRAQYQCDIQTKKWNLIFEQKNFTCPGYQIPPMAPKVNVSEPLISQNISTSTRSSYFTPDISSSVDDCSQSHLSTLISHLPTNPRYIYSRQLISYSSSYYDIKLVCQYNNLIEITYRCDRRTRQWVYVYGNTNHFRRCSPLCNENEQHDLLNKYFTRSEQEELRVEYLERRKSLRLRCFNRHENRWRSVYYKCGTMTISKSQWYRLHSCFSSTSATTMPTAMISLTIDELTPTCPPSITPGDPCGYQTGEYIFDSNGCERKICPALSQLCRTIRCPPERICRVIACRTCIYTNYLQAVCDYQREPSLCEHEKEILLLNDYESITRWERQTLAIVRRYASEQRQRLTAPWPVLTIN